jgi:hypothetical protein
MPSNVEEIWKNAVDLSIAWEELADHGMPGFNYREKLRELRNFDEDRTVEQSERRFYLLEDKERKLKGDYPVDKPRENQPLSLGMISTAATGGHHALRKFQRHSARRIQSADIGPLDLVS